MNGAESARSLRAEQPEHAGKPGDVCGQLNHIAGNFPGESLRKPQFTPQAAKIQRPLTGIRHIS